ncbi:hypothetical protein LAZ67_5004095, partial [Cordylochernes scorpioides]
MATTKIGVASSIPSESSSVVHESAKSPSSSQASKAISTHSPNEATISENMQKTKHHFSPEDRKKFDEERKATYESRSKLIKSTVQFESIPNATAEDHLIGIANIIGYKNIHSVGKMNGQAIVSVANNELAQTLIDGGFKVKDITVFPCPLFKPSKKYILSGVLAFIQDQDLKIALEPYGQMISSRPLPFPTDNPLLKHLSSLRREIVFKNKEKTPMPATLNVPYMDRNFTIFIGEYVVCNGCRRHGHVKNKCPFDPNIRATVTRTFSEALNPSKSPVLPSETPKEAREPTLRPSETPSRKLPLTASSDEKNCQKEKNDLVEKSRPDPQSGLTAAPSHDEMGKDISSVLGKELNEEKTFNAAQFLAGLPGPSTENPTSEDEDNMSTSKSDWMVETRSGKMQDPAQERIQAEESAKPQPGATIGRDASSDPVVLNPNIDIPKYDGTEDPRPWIESLEEIGFLYHWADYIISRYAAMNMTGSAKTWLNLHKASFTSWENIKIRLIQDFSLDANKEELRMKLNRMQHWNEPAIRFAEDILVLCNKVDPAMEEETKIEHVIGGLKKEYSFALYLNPPKTTDDLLVVCKKMDYFEKKYRERVEKSRNLYNGPRYSRPQQQSRYVPPTAARNYQNTSRPQAPVSNNYKNDSPPTPRQYRNNFPQPSTPRRPYNPNFVPKPNLQRNTYNKSQEVSKNRTEDGRPICFKCNKPGHVARYCRVKFIRILEEDPADTQEKVEEKCQMNETSEKSGPRLYADIGTFEALVDTGADLSVVDLRTALDTGHGISKLAKICAGPDGKKLDMVGSIFLNIKIDDETLSHNFVILKTHLRTLILGRDFLKKMNAKIDCKQETIKYDLTNNHDEINFEMLKIKSAKDSIVPECSMKLIKALVETEDGEYIIEESSKMFQTNGLRLARSLINVINRETHIWITNPYPRPLKIMKNQTLAFGSSPAKINVSREREVEKNEEPRFQINENLSPKEQKELKQVLERYGDLFSSRLGRTNLAKHRIDTEDAKPIKHKPYRVSAKERDIIKEQIDEMLTEGIIRPSSSPWSFPVILVKKRDGKYRFCVDYRKLNNVTVKDVYPIPRIDEVMDTLQGSTHFSAIDLRSGYWQVEVEERDKEKTAFTTAHGLYEFNVMSFGLCNAPATFERNMENMLGNLRWQICLCYLDDVIIYSPDFPTHLKRLEAVFRCFRESNLRLNDKKCRFAFEELEILGYITSKHERQEEAFQTLKTALLSPPILGHFNPNAPTYVHTDASNIGIGATLVQDIGGEEKVISYLSRTLSKAEQNYSTTEKECLAVVWSMSKLRPYLYGRHFKIVTDHHALCWLKNLKDPTGRLARWALKIQEYDFDIIHKSGKKHLDADGLSRGPLPETDWDEDFERLFLNQITDEEDKFIESVKKNLNGSRRSIAQNFKEEDGCLFKKNPNPEGRAWLLVVPENKKREIMKEYHNHMSNGHLGVARTMYRIKSKYFWPSMLKDVSEFIKTCHLCQSRKGSNQLPSGLLQPIPPANFPFERIGIDFVGPLPSTKNRKKWIIVLSDYYTRYAETRAVSEATVKEVSKFLVEDIFLRHGAPQYLISDRGSQFTSNLMKEVMKTCKIKHCFTTSYHPQTNGLTERLNRTLINMLSMYVNTDQKNWDEILPFITHAYNTTIQETTGYSPFFLMFGREPTSLLDDRNISVDIDKDDYDEYIKHHLDKINRTRKLVINNTIKTQERMKKNYDKKHMERSYEPGELVAVWTPIRKIGKCEKLLRKYFGPYRILKKLSNVNYLIEPKDNPGQDPLIVHVSRIKPYFERIDEVNHEDVTTSGEGEVQSYEEEFAKQLLETLIEDRERIEERERIEDRKRIEDRERIERERKEQMVMEFELEKLRIQTTRGNNDTSRSTSNDAHYEIRKLMPKYESKDNDLSFYLILFERQAKRLGLDEDQWAFSLLGLLPYEMTQLIARETEEQSGDYRFVKRLLLKRYKLSPEQFRQKFEKHERSQKGSWRDFAFELRGYFNEWIEGMNVENFDALKDLSVTNQLKKKVPNVLRNHLIDDWTKLNDPDELADKLDEYENVRNEMGPPHWNAKHLIPPSFQQKSARFPNQSEVKETKQGTNVSGQDAARNEISETYPNTLRRMVNRTIRNDKGEPKCFNCNQFGHIARDCPAPRTTLTCRGCGQTGHKERNCTRPKEGLKVANLEVEGLETVPPDVYLKDVKIDNKETVKAMIDTGSSSCLMRESVARRISVDIEPDSTSLYGIGNQTAPAARTVGKTTVDLEIDGIVGREITVFIVNDDAQPYDLLIGRTWTDLPYVSFARIGKNLHIGYSSEFPFANLQEEIKSRRIELRATETVQLESDSINFTSAITDEVKDGYVLFTGVDDACVDSLLEVVDGKTTVPIISAGKGKLRVRKNQCVGRVELLNLDDIVVNLDVAEDSFQTKNEEKREGQDQMKRKRPILPEYINVNHSLTSKERQEILDVVNEYRDCFALGMEELGCTDVTKMDIKEVDGSKPVCLRPYKTTASEREAIREIVREWKDNGIVTETRSPYASPVLLVRKKTGDHRLVVDYRRLNIQTVKDKFPLPRIDDLLEGLRNAKFFTTLDLAHGYLQIPLTDKAKLKTAFITPDDTGQFERMIFGLANAPAEFQRLMHTVLGPLLNKKAFCYLDDVIIPAKDWREMIERLREVLERIRSAKLTLKPSKCEFGRREVEFLGYVISTGGLKPGPRKIKAIEEFPEPKNVHDIRRFLGLTNFFRRFVKDFARKAEPLSRLTKKGSQFEWKEEQRRSFGGLRKDLVEYPVLAHYNPELKTEVHCDASAEGLAGMVLQMDEDCKWRLVYCVSKKTTEAEKMYHSSKLELMAIVWTLDRLRQFLVGIKFTVVTDCQALVYMNAKKTTNPQIARWYNLIQEYDFEIRHKPGEKMAHVDGMSRAPVDDPRDTMEEIVEKNLEVCFTITLEEQILMIQHSDPELRDLIQIFRKDPCDRTVGEQNRINDYSYKGGRLFRMVKNGEEERALYVIPKSMRKSLIVKFHDLMGHFATDRTVNKIKELYWFPSMKRYVRRHVAMCLECLFNKVPGGKQQGFLHPIKSDKRPFSIVHMGHVGPFVRSTKGNQELLVIVDNLTIFVRLSPVRNTSTQNVLKVMKSFVNDFGLPDKIISDRGSCFTSRQFEEFCRGNGIHHTLNSTKHPQGNGMVERVNRTVLSTIATSIEDPRRKDWDLKIKEVERDLNNAVNKTTNKTPFETLHGYSPRFHDGILRRLADEDVDPWTEPDRIQESVRTQIENKQEIMKTYYDKKKCRTIQFEVGEIVVMRHVPKMTGEPTKAQPKYRGPLIITEVLPSDTYRVTQLSERTSGRFYTTTAHISQLKSWHSEEDDSATEESPDEEPEVEDTPRRNPRRSCNARFNRGRLKSRNGRIDGDFGIREMEILGSERWRCCDHRDGDVGIREMDILGSERWRCCDHRDGDVVIRDGDFRIREMEMLGSERWRFWDQRDGDVGIREMEMLGSERWRFWDQRDGDVGIRE